jgi:hypothetical protein
MKLIFPPPPAGKPAESAHHRRGHRAVPICEPRGEITRLAIREDDDDRLLRIASARIDR